MGAGTSAPAQAQTPDVEIHTDNIHEVFNEEVDKIENLSVAKAGLIDRLGMALETNPATRDWLAALKDGIRKRHPTADAAAVDAMLVTLVCDIVKASINAMNRLANTTLMRIIDALGPHLDVDVKHESAVALVGLMWIVSHRSVATEIHIIGDADPKAVATWAIFGQVARIRSTKRAQIIAEVNELKNDMKSLVFYLSSLFELIDPVTKEPNAAEIYNKIVNPVYCDGYFGVVAEKAPVAPAPEPALPFVFVDHAVTNLRKLHPLWLSKRWRKVSFSNTTLEHDDKLNPYYSVYGSNDKLIKNIHDGDADFEKFRIIREDYYYWLKNKWQSGLVYKASKTNALGDEGDKKTARDEGEASDAAKIKKQKKQEEEEEYEQPLSEDGGEGDADFAIADDDDDDEPEREADGDVIIPEYGPEDEDEDEDEEEEEEVDFMTASIVVPIDEFKKSLDGWGTRALGLAWSEFNGPWADEFKDVKFTSLTTDERRAAILKLAQTEDGEALRKKGRVDRIIKRDVKEKAKEKAEKEKRAEERLKYQVDMLDAICKAYLSVEGDEENYLPEKLDPNDEGRKAALTEIATWSEKKLKRLLFLVDYNNLHASMKEGLPEYYGKLKKDALIKLITDLIDGEFGSLFASSKLRHAVVSAASAAPAGEAEDDEAALEHDAKAGDAFEKAIEEFKEKEQQEQQERDEDVDENDFSLRATELDDFVNEVNTAWTKHMCVAYLSAIQYNHGIPLSVKDEQPLKANKETETADLKKIIVALVSGDFGRYFAQQRFIDAVTKSHEADLARKKKKGVSTKVVHLKNTHLGRLIIEYADDNKTKEERIVYYGPGGAFDEAAYRDANADKIASAMAEVKKWTRSVLQTYLGRNYVNYNVLPEDVKLMGFVYYNQGTKYAMTKDADGNIVKGALISEKKHSSEEQMRAMVLHLMNSKPFVFASPALIKAIGPSVVRVKDDKGDGTPLTEEQKKEKDKQAGKALAEANKRWLEKGNAGTLENKDKQDAFDKKFHLRAYAIPDAKPKKEKKVLTDEEKAAAKAQSIKNLQEAAEKYRANGEAGRLDPEKQDKYDKLHHKGIYAKPGAGAAKKKANITADALANVGGEVANTTTTADGGSEKPVAASAPKVEPKAPSTGAAVLKKKLDEMFFNRYANSKIDTSFKKLEEEKDKKKDGAFGDGHTIAIEYMTHAGRFKRLIATSESMVVSLVPMAGRKVNKAEAIAFYDKEYADSKYSDDDRAAMKKGWIGKKAVADGTILIDDGKEALYTLPLVIDNAFEHEFKGIPQTKGFLRTEYKGKIEGTDTFNAIIEIRSGLCTLVVPNFLNVLKKAPYGRIVELETITQDWMSKHTHITIQHDPVPAETPANVEGAIDLEDYQRESSVNIAPVLTDNYKVRLTRKADPTVSVNYQSLAIPATMTGTVVVPPADKRSKSTYAPKSIDITIVEINVEVKIAQPIVDEQVLTEYVYEVDFFYQKASNFAAVPAFTPQTGHLASNHFEWKENTRNSITTYGTLKFSSSIKPIKPEYVFEAIMPQNRGWSEYYFKTKLAIPTANITLAPK